MSIFERFNAIVAEMVRPGAKVLDIGTGNGLRLRELIEMCRKITDHIEWYAIDKSGVILEVASKNLHKYPNVYIQRGNGFDLRGIKDFEFDLVLGVKSCFYPIQAYRVLKNGGHYLYIGPGDKDWIEVRNLINRSEWPAYRSEEQARQEMEQACFTVIFSQSDYPQEHFSSSKEFIDFFKEGFIVHSLTPEETKIVEDKFDSPGSMSFMGHVWFVFGKKESTRNNLRTVSNANATLA